MASYDDIYNQWASKGSWLRNRVIVAIGHYAAYLAGLGAGATADQQEFVQRVMPGSNAEIEADYILWFLVNDPDIQAASSAVTDAVVQSKTEYALSTLGRVKGAV